MLQRSCKQCGISFVIRNQDLALLDQISPQLNGQVYAVPPPLLCPTCRRHRRLAWRNERHLYRRQCDASGKQLISNIAPDAPFLVYDKSYWFSDNWNALSYGRDFNFSKTFAENFRELQLETPRFSIQQQEPMENSLYCNYASNCQHCYFLFDSDYCRDSYYSYVLKRSNDCCDTDFTSDSELCYETINCKNCYNLKFSQNCQNCSDSFFLDSCIGCKECAFSTNLRNKEFYFKNNALSPEGYRRALAALDLQCRSAHARERIAFQRYLQQHPRKYYQGTNNENTTGNYIFSCKNVFESFNVQDAWDIAYCDNLYRARNCSDVSSFGEQIDWIYETTTAGLETHNCAFCFTAVVGSHDLLYCDTAYSSANCFGCVSMHRKEYCILNKQYSKSSYEELAGRIIEHMRETGEWGEFLPVSVSPFAYNETVAHDYFPLEKSEAEVLCYRWRIPDIAEYQQATYEPPETIDAVTPDVINGILACSSCGRNYKISKPELSLYQTQRIAIPDTCSNCRQLRRQKWRGPRELFDCKCSSCGKVLRTTYSPLQAAQLLCEECYYSVVD